MQLFVGTFSHENGDSLNVFDYDAETGGLKLRAISRALVNPSFLSLAPDGTKLYAVSEISGGRSSDTVQPMGYVAALSVDPLDWSLTLINAEPAMGPRPCHVVVDPDGHCLFVANYRGENFGVFPIRSDGGVGPAAAIIRHEGSSVDPQRQRGSHPHSCALAPGKNWLYVADLGIDKIKIYDVDFSKGHVRPHAQDFAEVPPGSGPRHMRFHPSGNHLYVTNEMGGTITVFAFNNEDGSLSRPQTIDTLPAGYQGRRWNSEIAFLPSGRYLYAANRGHDSLARFAVAENGELTLLEHVPSGGKTPRHFAIDPAGRRLLVGNQDSGTIVSFDIDPDTGKLTRTGRDISVANPVCLVFGAP